MQKVILLSRLLIQLVTDTILPEEEGFILPGRKLLIMRLPDIMMTMATKFS